MHCIDQEDHLSLKLDSPYSPSEESGDQDEQYLEPLVLDPEPDVKVTPKLLLSEEDLEEESIEANRSQHHRNS